MSGFRIEKLHRRHAVETFDCGEEALNRFLVRFALANQMANASQTYVGLADDDAIVGFYTLAVGEVRHEEAPGRLTKGLARHAVPIMLLARLGVSVRRQGGGIGAGLLRDAILRTLQVADIAGVRALAVHAKNEAARSFYERFDFLPSPTDPLHLFALIKDLRSL
ncbi:MAG: GNAT family N-acetyltransferase [Azonexus sp.]|uniref:GNAT family N-acetyltransferase n=1 Tax=Azonexus sp. TaxID=1872668 RepID=UPI002839D9FE|nr:GNAT family N-acetyltransferase [Azonexus sp.]MDR0776651.1 GNAT family N-acetyltransferase [Azonexus sp.]